MAHAAGIITRAATLSRGAISKSPENSLLREAL
jgi:hypothetical protein